MNAPPFDEIECFVDILEALHSQLRPRGISAKGLVAQDFEEVDEDYLDAGQPSLQASVRQMRFTPSDKSVTKSLTVTSRALTFEFNLCTLSVMAICSCWPI